MVLDGAYGAWWCRWVRPTHFLHMVLKVILYGSWCIMMQMVNPECNRWCWKWWSWWCRWCIMVQMMNPTHSLQMVLNAMVLGGADGADVAGWCRWWVQRTLYRLSTDGYCMVVHIVHNGANVFCKDAEHRWCWMRWMRDDEFNCFWKSKNPKVTTRPIVEKEG